MNILIVEDDQINAFVLSKFVQEGNKILISGCPSEVMEIIKSQAIDLILMDVNLGASNIDGVELLKMVRDENGPEKIPVIATTAYAMTGDRERLIEAGFDAYVAKPIKREELVKKIELVLRSE